MKRILKNKKKKKGFSLMELLVVLAIVGILAAAFTFYFGGAQKKARDARRKQDVKGIQEAVEMYYDDNGHYPDPALISLDQSFTPDGIIYMDKVPDDPKVGWDYYYESDGTYYRVYARLENENDEDAAAGVYPDTDCTDSSPSCNYGGTSPNTTLPDPVAEPSPGPTGVPTSQPTAEPTPCSGCIFAENCYSGTYVFACGTGGAACVSCDDDKDCTTDLCSNGVCQHSPKNSGSCGVNGMGHCVNGVCTDVPTAACYPPGFACMDGMECCSQFCQNDVCWGTCDDYCKAYDYSKGQCFDSTDKPGWNCSAGSGANQFCGASTPNCCCCEGVCPI
jgi:general secretion pathway protein G